MITLHSGGKIGLEHLKNKVPCQDRWYSIILPDGRIFSIVCDGCSAGKKVHLGALRMIRIAVQVAHMSHEELVKLGQGDPLLGILRETVERCQNSKIDTDHLLATFVASYAYQQKTWFRCYGDGHIVLKNNQGWKCIQMSWGGIDGDLVPYPINMGRNKLPEFMKIIQYSIGKNGIQETENIVPSEKLEEGYAFIEEDCDITSVFTDGISNKARLDGRRVKMLLIYKCVCNEILRYGKIPKRLTSSDDVCFAGYRVVH